jgi:phosphate transport system substrate-binding protein
VILVLILVPITYAQTRTYKIGALIWHETKHDNDALDGFKEGIELSGLKCVFDIKRSYEDEALTRRFLRKWKEEKVDLIFIAGTKGTLWAMEEAKDIPIVFSAVTNPVVSGIADSWDRPGGNATGSSNWIESEVKMTIFKKCVPYLKTLGVIYNPKNPVPVAEVTRAKIACDSMGITIKEATVKGVDDIETAIGNLINQDIDALWIPIEKLVYNNMSKVGRITFPEKLPVLSSTLQGTGLVDDKRVEDEVGIVAVTVDYKKLGRLSVSAAIEILTKGKKPGDIPIKTMPHHLTVVNLNSVHNTNYEIPPAFLVEADRVLKGFFGKKVIVAGTGDSQELLRELAKALEKELDGGKIEIPESVGSSGGIKALTKEETDLARVARPLKDSEQKLGLTYKLFAKAPVVFVVHPDMEGIDNITTKQIIDIYSGKITNWSQLGGKPGKIYPITREAGDSCLRVVTKFIPEFADVANVVAKVVYSTPETVQTLEEHKKTIGYTTLTAIAGTKLRVLKFDGIEASAENVLNEKCKLTVPYAIVYKSEPRGLAKRFVDFIYSEDGRKIISKEGAVPVRDREPRIN